MTPYHVIGFRANAQNGYDCSFTVMFPANRNITQSEINEACQSAVNEAHRLHGNVRIISQQQTTVMMNR